MLLQTDTVTAILATDSSAVSGLRTTGTTLRMIGEQDCSMDCPEPSQGRLMSYTSILGP